MYLSFDDYILYGGTLDKTAFNDLEMDAEATINWYTFNRLKRPEWKTVLDSEELKRCTYQLIRLKQMENELLAANLGGVSVGGTVETKPGIKQETNDGVSTTYNVLSAADLLEYLNGNKNDRDLVDKYLGCVVNELGRKLLYRGVYMGE